MRHRSGFSLLETLVAIVVFQFAMLALAAGAAVAVRDLAAARRLGQAHEIARNRVEELSSNPCPATGAGTQAANRFVEYWRVDPANNRRLVSDSVVFARPNGTLGFVVARGTTICMP